MHSKYKQNTDHEYNLSIFPSNRHMLWMQLNFSAILIDKNIAVEMKILALDHNKIHRMQMSEWQIMHKMTVNSFENHQKSNREQ